MFIPTSQFEIFAIFSHTVFAFFNDKFGETIAVCILGCTNGTIKFVLLIFRLILTYVRK